MAIPCVLSIAGSDSGGGAGIQADLKAFARSGVHGMTAITAITVQNTVEVRSVHAVEGDVIRAQIAAVVEDIGVDAIKIGMLGSADTIAAVAAELRGIPAGTPVVVDPVMVAESGGRLLQEEAEQALRDLILPLATVVTPNLPEARVLAKMPAPDGGDAAGEVEEVQALARAIHLLGPDAVIITGGHRAAATDILFDGSTFTEIAGERFREGAAHGSGCTHSSTLAAQLARGLTLPEAAVVARQIAGEAVRDGLREVGHGAGPVDVIGLTRRDWGGN